eukprot:NODE_31526_length_394_cov_23.513109.p4 GENE.NODE_31526_length_394_cov_23.513109~~NODE_31526_length_394_cov_23.513109.p4  ORF type:complete len:69 (-),score=35.12 NODE_31526_length_394_cov_23.513109:52-258(-)
MPRGWQVGQWRLPWEALFLGWSAQGGTKDTMDYHNFEKKKKKKKKKKTQRRSLKKKKRHTKKKKSVAL